MQRKPKDENNAGLPGDGEVLIGTSVPTESGCVRRYSCVPTPPPRLNGRACLLFIVCFLRLDLMFICFGQEANSFRIHESGVCITDNPRNRLTIHSESLVVYNTMEMFPSSLLIGNPYDWA